MEPIESVPEPAETPSSVIAEEPATMSEDTIRLLAADIAAAEHDLAEAHRMLVSGLPLRHPSRFGWPGQLLRTAVLRLIRPQTQLDVRAHERQVQAMRRVIEGLRRGLPDASVPSDTGAPAAPDADAVAESHNAPD